MILTTDVRKLKLSELRESGNTEIRQKLHYRGDSNTFDVFKIDLDHLIYNRHNGRLEVEMMTWEKENAAAPDVYDDEVHKLIDALLWESNTARNKQTLRDLTEKGQQRPGIVSLDGVIIDGNRRAMLLRRLEQQKKVKQYFDAIILPDAYADNQAEIARLETQYQIGEDAKLEYGPLQKYLHARRLHLDLGIEMEEIDNLMGEDKGYTKRLLEIMELMDDYLHHIGCPGLYTMLKDEKSGTKEGMFVDLYADLKRLRGGQAHVPWDFDPDLDPLQLQLIQFDYLRLGDVDTQKSYRDISHHSSGKNFFASKEIWVNFRDSHQSDIDPVTAEMGSLEDFILENPDQYENKVDAARARDNEWRNKVKNSMKGTFGQAQRRLALKMEKLKPGDYLKRAWELLEKIDIDSRTLLSARVNLEIAIEINRLTFEIKKKFERM